MYISHTLSNMHHIVMMTLVLGICTTEQHALERNGAVWTCHQMSVHITCNTLGNWSSVMSIVKISSTWSDLTVLQLN